MALWKVSSVFRMPKMAARNKWIVYRTHQQNIMAMKAE